MTDLAFSPEALERKALLGALRAFKRGDFSTRLPMDLVGIEGEIAEAFNDAVDVAATLTSEFARIRDDVGREGQITERVRVPAAVGSWAKCVESINALIVDLVQPTSEVARVIESVAKGHLSQTMTLEIEGRPLRGEFLRIGKVVNTMVDQLGAFASEVSRVAREVGTEGKLGGQARVAGVAGTWRDLTENVNLMAANLTGQVRNIAEVTTAVAKGDLSKKITVDVKGEILELKSTINTMVDQLSAFASEVSRVAREVGTDGKLGGQAQVPGVAGTWKDLTDNVNAMAANLTNQVRNIAEVTTAVAKGDLSKKITVAVKGEILELKSTVNTMVDQLNAFASEVSRVSREVGTDGKLGGQARVSGVAGTWKDLTDNVNAMAANLTNQVRNIAEVTTAVAKGDLSKKITVDVKGEILELKSTINTMVDQLNAFASEVSRVAREVGTEGRLGGQAQVPGVAGTWKDLTKNVNQLAANLTAQVRAIAEVATAVAKGDLTRSIMVEARGEVAALKDNINEMIRNLKDTTLKNTEQDWLKTNLAKFTRMLQGHRDLVTVSRLILSELAPLVNAQQGVLYTAQTARADAPALDLLATYASEASKSLPKTIQIGEGLIGQCAYEGKHILLEDVPPNYIQISSGLGSTAPLNVIILPVLFEGEVKAVLELASFRKYAATHLSFLGQLAEIIGIVFNTIEASMRTENLLKQSQLLTKELQSQQEELKKSNDRLEQQAENLQHSESLLKKQQEALRGAHEQLLDKARLLSEQMEQVEYKNKEIEHAKAALEEKAEQLALSSRYKSEFLANMSHELRTPLNSLLILAKILTDNKNNNLTPKQIEYAQTIYAAGTDLLALINDILDLAKIESGTVTLNIAAEPFSELLEYVERTFRQIAEDKKLGFTVETDLDLPVAIQTDAKRLQQILKNLLSNAFKFTEHGQVSLRIESVRSGWTPGVGRLDAANQVVAFVVTDTGIGIPEHKQKIIFEAFEQADGTTSRQFGGTGLGLSISRELTRLLGGEIRVRSTLGKGSTFALYLPLTHELASIEDTTSTYPLLPPAKREGGHAVPRAVTSLPVKAPVNDDSENLRPDDRVVLIVDDDVKLSSTLLDAAHASGFKGVVVPDASVALGMIRDQVPAAIMLNSQLADMNGRAVLNLLKHDAGTRHVPVNVICPSDQAHNYRVMGAFGTVRKSDTKEMLREVLAKTRQLVDSQARTLLIADRDERNRHDASALLRGGGVQATAVDSGKQVLDALRRASYDCVVLGATLRDMTALDLIKKIAESKTPIATPIVLYGVTDLGVGARSTLEKLAKTLVLKTVPTSEAAFEETTLFLHQAVNDLPSRRRHLLATTQQASSELTGKKVLIIDDDIRNIFALTGVLEQHGMSVVNAENGKKGLEKLKNEPAVDVVLMDIMMPELDGYDTIRIIRGSEEFENLPIIAVTAKAMQGDREKCLDAGASDYVAKPVNVEYLLALLRVILTNPVGPGRRKGRHKVAA